MKAHLREHHNVRGPQGRPTSNWYTPHITVVDCQRFFVAVPSQYHELGITQFFLVHNEAAAPSPEALLGTESSRVAAQQTTFNQNSSSATVDPPITPSLARDKD